MAENNPTGKNLIGVVTGAVLLFGALSVIPIIVIWYQRRRAAARHPHELHNLESNGSMRYVAIQRWLLDQQTTPHSDNLARYGSEQCPICLSTLFAPSHSSMSELAATAKLGPCLPPPPQPACIPPSSRRLLHTSCTISPLPVSPDHGATHCHDTTTATVADPALDTIANILILNQCKHAFHADCLVSWFKYGQYRCPTCQTSYGPMHSPGPAL
ncbi:hypothetical protein P175DRAFT_0332669 [Aspergillus ochraceoroseus IBT 24754]|uniref:RING-type domain-containing protein n=1 Tax=Aspergillus ochraceoroseus IBT 24754 TaxID=1392256 RepID=A0A2T5LRB2_9EURO|nr:uncharacterized protein P175DRAFT_0332669 [Aspergillus ochraceoroseus IBT 24754]PTU18824.1 hypothetical protein P175DRAFT_0332669 [Aspergillus ochraceoroseus IBT 24754]